MSAWQLLRASLAFHWRIHLAVGLGVAAATAVLTGALLVGDSVRGSLRSLMLDRLGNIEEVLVGPNFLRPELAASIQADPAFQAHYETLVPGVLLSGTVEKPDPKQAVRVSQVTLLGTGEEFWTLQTAGPRPKLAPGEVVLNEPLAAELKAAVGDEVLLRIPTPSDVPADSPLGKKTETTRSQRLKVSAIIPAQGLGQFGLRPNQQIPLCAFATTATLADLVEQPGKVNALFVAGRVSKTDSLEASEALTALLKKYWQPSDAGLRIEKITLGSGDDEVSQYINITSQRMMLPQAVIDAANRASGKGMVQQALTYLANRIEAGPRRSIPYSTVVGVNKGSPLTLYELEINKPLADDEIVLVDWAAKDLKVQPGDEVALTYYEAESTHGKLVEPPPAKFRVRAIYPLAPPKEPPTQANDPHFAPELKGVTDSDSIGDWDLPFELVEEIRPQDDQYWTDYRTTPKAYITLKKARELWSSRFGDTTTLRISGDVTDTAESYWESKLAPLLNPAELSLEFIPVRRKVLEAASGTTPFNLLFIGFSFFIIAAALMLTMLLFRLGVEQRAREIGIVQAVGWPRNRITRLLMGEGLVVSALGAAFGALIGVGYAWLMLVGLRTWWLAAITTPFLRLYITPGSLIGGYLIGVIVSLLTIAWGLRRLRKLPTRGLLAGQAGDSGGLSVKPPRIAKYVAYGLLMLAPLIALLGSQLSGEAQAGAFFGTGFLALIGLLISINNSFRRAALITPSFRRLDLWQLAGRNTARNATRSTLTIGLVAVASFLIVAISAFRLAPTEQGTGYIALIGESDDPIVQDLNTPAGRADLAFSDADQRLLSLVNFYSCRVRSGDDASCLNLYQTTQPRILGLPSTFLKRGEFGWAGTAAQTEAETKNPWLLLEKALPDGEIPIVLDMATATYSLHLSGVGAKFEMPDDNGGQLKLQVVGLLKNSIFQGSVLMSEANFLKEFPLISGYRTLLVEIPNIFEVQERSRLPLAMLHAREKSLAGDKLGTPEASSDPAVARVQSEIKLLESFQKDIGDLQTRVQDSLENTLGDKGLDVKPAADVLAGFLAVQNTYLSTFQSLGALGLLLGTFGLATVQLRSMLERRSELALLRASGWPRARLTRLVMSENISLLLGGLYCGTFTAILAVVPLQRLQDSAVPWASLGAMLGLVLVTGIFAGWLTIRSVLAAPLLPALRGE